MDPLPTATYMGPWHGRQRKAHNQHFGHRMDDECGWPAGWDSGRLLLIFEHFPTIQWWFSSRETWGNCQFWAVGGGIFLLFSNVVLPPSLIYYILVKAPWSAMADVNTQLLWFKTLYFKISQYISMIMNSNSTDALHSSLHGAIR